MVTTFKVLGQANPAATTLATLYTVPALTQAVASSVVVANQSPGAATFRLAVAVAGAANAANQYLVYDGPISGNDTVGLTLGITLGAADVVRVYASTATLSFNIFGEEVV